MFDELRSILPSTCDTRGGVLHVGGVSVRELATEYHTPVIAYDAAHVRAAALAWADAFASYEPGALVAYASKAFTSVELLKLLGGLGLGVDVASAGELMCASHAGIDPAMTVAHGNNKSRAELEGVIGSGVGYLVLDAPSELALAEDIARELQIVQPVLVRINPDIEVETHRYISTSHGGSKFGVPSELAAELLERAHASDWLDARGVHVHLGSQLLDTAPWTRVLEWLAGWALELRERTGIQLHTLDVGGGLGIAYTEEQTPPTPADIARVVVGTLERAWAGAGLTLPTLIVEPGRSIVGQAAMTIYSVGVVKDAGDIRYVNVDGGMSDNPRPVLYQARYRAMLAERAHEAPTGNYWVAGVHCESGDVLIEDAPLPAPQAGELLVIPATGAYAASMASTYNMIPRCAVVLVEDGAHRVLLRREDPMELLAREPIRLADD